MEALFASPALEPVNEADPMPTEVNVAVTPGSARMSRAMRSAMVTVAASEVPSGARMLA